jgi:hypothetical protein
VQAGKAWLALRTLALAGRTRAARRSPPRADLAEQTTIGGAQWVGPQLTELEDDLRAGAVTIVLSHLI